MNRIQLMDNFPRRSIQEFPGASQKDAMCRMKLLKGQVASGQEPVNSAMSVKSNSQNNTFKNKEGGSCFVQTVI